MSHETDPKSNMSLKFWEQELECQALNLVSTLLPLIFPLHYSQVLWPTLWTINRYVHVVRINCATSVTVKADPYTPVYPVCDQS